MHFLLISLRPNNVKIKSQFMKVFIMQYIRLLIFVTSNIVFIILFYTEREHIGMLKFYKQVLK